MKKTINMTTSTHDTDRYKDTADLRAFYKDRDLEGIELMFIGNNNVPEKITANEIIGVHLSYFTYWVDFWRGDTDGMIKEYGSLEAAYERFGGSDRSAIVNKFVAELDNAEKLHAEYVVFHVGDVTLEGTFTYKHKYTEDEVNEATCELINEILKARNYSFYFLVENLWWAGFTFTNYDSTKKLLENINYEKKGIMLDTGHLLHTNRSLRTQDEAVDYIHEMLDLHGDLCGYIKGIHLNQTLSGEYVESIISVPPPKMEDDIKERYWQAGMHVYKIDNHQPFSTDKIKTVVERINPMFLTHELITNDLEQHIKHLDIQINAVKM